MDKKILFPLLLIVATVFYSCGNLYAPRIEGVYMVKFKDASYKEHVILDEYDYPFGIDSIQEYQMVIDDDRDFADRYRAGSMRSISRHELPDEIYIPLHGDFYLVHPVQLYVQGAGTYKAYNLTWQEYRETDTLSVDDMVILDEEPFLELYRVNKKKKTKDLQEFIDRVNKTIDKGKMPTDKNGYLKI